MVQARKFVVAGALGFAVGCAVRPSAGATLLYQYGFNNASGAPSTGSVESSPILTTNGGATFTGQGVSAAAGNSPPNGATDNAYNYNGTVTTGVATGTDAVGTLPGTTQNPDSNLANISQLTVTAWVQSSANLSTANARILELSPTAGGDGQGIFFGLNGAGTGTQANTAAGTSVTGNGYHLQAYVNNVQPNGGISTGFNSTTGTYTGNISQHQVNGGSVSSYEFVAFTLDLTQTTGSNLDFYTGSLTSAVSLLDEGGGSLSASGTINALSGGQIVIGNRPSDAARGFPGLLDDIRIYNGVLQTSDLETIREGDINAAATPEPASLGLLAFGGLALLRRRREVQLPQISAIV